jgi:hypothetical protein
MRFFLIILFLFSQKAQAQSIAGAWKNTSDTTQTLILATENYITISEYSTNGNKFIKAFGGKYEVTKTEEILIDLSFHSTKPELVGSLASHNISIKKKNFNVFDREFEKTSEKSNALSGLWRITSILRNGAMSEMQKGPRKTLKIMAGGYFQWFAINTTTSEFFGTGGGIYTLKANTYTEEIVFFSRDNTRVGAKLSFGVEINSTTWTHSGKSSKGDPLKEIWEKQ